MVREEFSERHLQESEEERAEHRQRDRAEQNDEWIAETVELRGENEKNQHDCESEGWEKLASFGAQLARFAGIVEHVAFG